MYKTLLLTGIIASILGGLFSGCKKEKTYTIKGRLLQNRSHPIPVTDYKLTIYQRGSGGAPIAIGTFPSIAEGKTDNAGYFRINFKEGKGTFLGIPTSNQAAVTLSGTYATSFPNFYIYNFAYKTLPDDQPIYLYKKADTVFIILKTHAPVVATDSFTIYADNLRGDSKRIKRGLTASANAELFLDTIYQAIFPYYDYETNKYINKISIYKNRDLLPLSHSFPKNDSLPEQDEKSLLFTFNSY